MQYACIIIPKFSELQCIQWNPEELSSIIVCVCMWMLGWVSVSGCMHASVSVACIYVLVCVPACSYIH